MANISIFSIFIYKPSYWQKLGLIVLLKIDKNLKISFYSNFIPFCLAINLDMKDSKMLLFDFKKIIK